MKIAVARIAITVALLLATAATAQQTLPLSGIANVTLRVKDFAASRAFYQSLGYQQTFRNSGESASDEAWFKINDHQFIELIALGPKQQSPRFESLCFETDDLTAIHEDYTSHGLTPSAVNATSTGELFFTLAGPVQLITQPSETVLATSARQQIQFLQYQPDSRQAHDTGQHLGPDRISDRLLAVILATLDPEAAREIYLNDLSFKPLPAHQNLLHLPGNSREYVAITPAMPQGAHAGIVFETDALSRAERHLHREHIAYTRPTQTGDVPALQLNDPDGNLILIQAATPKVAERTKR